MTQPAEQIGRNPDQGLMWMMFGSLFAVNPIFGVLMLLLMSQGLGKMKDKQQQRLKRFKQTKQQRNPPTEERLSSAVGKDWKEMLEAPAPKAKKGEKFSPSR